MAKKYISNAHKELYECEEQGLFSAGWRGSHMANRLPINRCYQKVVTSDPCDLSNLRIKMSLGRGRYRRVVTLLAIFFKVLG